MIKPRQKLITFALLAAILLTQVALPLTADAQWMGADFLTGNQTGDYTSGTQTTDDGGGILNTIWKVLNPAIASLISALDTIIALAIKILASIFNLIASLILWIAGFFFDAALYISVTKFSVLIDKTPAIEKGWEVFRGVANFLMIFVLLYLAGSLILQLSTSETRRSLTRLIIVALLINFSMFFTSVIIDISNVAAYNFYQLATKDNLSIGTAISEALSVDFFRGMGVSGNQFTDVSKAVEHLDSVNAAIQGLGGILLRMVGAFVLFSGGILMAIRMVVLILLMVLSPLAFFAYAFPPTAHLTKIWLNRLLSESFWLPVYVLFLYVVVEIGKSDAILNLKDTSIKNGMGVLFNTVVIAGLMIGALLVAKQLGGHAATAAMIGGGVATGFLATKLAKVTAKKGGRLYGALRHPAETGRAVGAAAKGGGGRVWTGLKSFGRAPLTTTGRGLRAGVAGAVTKAGGLIKKLPERERVERAMTGAIPAASELIGRVTKPFGIPPMMGRTKDEIRESREKKKKEVEAKQFEEAESRKKKIDRAIARQNTTGIDEILGQTPDKEIAGWEVKRLEEVATRLKSSQMKTIFESKDLTPDEKQRIGAARIKPLQEAVETLNTKPPTDPAFHTAVNVVVNQMQQLNATEKAKLPETILTNKEVIKQLSPADLSKMVDEEVRQSVRDVIRREVTVPAHPKSGDFTEWFNLDTKGRLF